MKNNINKVYNKLPKEKIVLSNKYKLSIAADLDRSYDIMRDALDIHSNSLNELESKAQTYMDAKEDWVYSKDEEVERFEELQKQYGIVYDILQELETKVGELGFAPSDLYPDYQELIETLDYIENEVERNRMFIISDVEIR
jgi:predicted nuclease with TOPRIM domain